MGVYILLLLGFIFHYYYYYFYYVFYVQETHYVSPQHLIIPDIFLSQIYRMFSLKLRVYMNSAYHISGQQPQIKYGLHEGQLGSGLSDGG